MSSSLLLLQRFHKEPSKTLDLGVFGKIPIHALSAFWVETHDKELLTLYQTKTARTLGGWVRKLGLIGFIWQRIKPRPIQHR